MLAFLPNLGGPEILIIFLVVLFLFGSKKIPDLARGLGKTKGEFEKARREFERELGLTAPKKSAAKKAAAKKAAAKKAAAKKAAAKKAAAKKAAAKKATAKKAAVNKELAPAEPNQSDTTPPSATSKSAVNTEQLPAEPNQPNTTPPSAIKELGNS